MGRGGGRDGRLSNMVGRRKPRATPPPNPLPEAERGNRNCSVPPLRFGEGARGWGFWRSCVIVLWDIDGTLIRSGGAGKAAMESALRDAGVEPIDHKVPFSGRTDPAIARDLLLAHGLEATPERVARQQQVYLGLLETMLPKIGGVVLPGVAEWLDRLDAAGAAQGLLTGNMRRGAEIKLRYFGLWERFAFGGFADEVWTRDEVAARARSSAWDVLGEAGRERDIWVVGDTPHDITCAKHIGAKSLGVGTGWHSLDELRAAGADRVVADLTMLCEWPA